MATTTWSRMGGWVSTNLQLLAADLPAGMVTLKPASATTTTSATTRALDDFFNLPTPASPVPPPRDYRYSES